MKNFGSEEVPESTKESIQELTEKLQAKISLDELREKQKGFVQGERIRFAPVKPDSEALQQYQKELKEFERSSPNMKGMVKHYIQNTKQVGVPVIEDLKQVKAMIFEGLVQKCLPVEPVINEAEAKVFDAFSKWLAGQEGPLDLNKGIYLFGDIGTGKTTLLELGRAVLACFKRANIPARKAYRVVYLDNLFNTAVANSNLSFLDEVSTGPLFIDDCREGHFNYRHFGKDMNPIAELLSVRYDAWRLKGSPTLMTSNLVPRQFSEALDDQRLSDRFKEMFNFVPFPGSNKRYS